jgi:hypothetical protein
MDVTRNPKQATTYRVHDERDLEVWQDGGSDEVINQASTG